MTCENNPEMCEGNCDCKICDNNPACKDERLPADGHGTLCCGRKTPELFKTFNG